MKNWSNSEKGNNYTDLLVGNRSLVIKLLMKTGGCTRSDLAQMSGLSQAAITKITAGLLEMGIIEENGHGKGEKGRRTICLQLRSKCCKVLGVKIGRKSYSAGILDLAGNMLCQQTVRINMGEEPETVLRGLSGLMNQGKPGCDRGWCFCSRPLSAGARNHRQDDELPRMAGV